MEKQQLKKAAELLQDRLAPIIGDIRKSEDGGNTKIEGKADNEIKDRRQP